MGDARRDAALDRLADLVARRVVERLVGPPELIVDQIADQAAALMLDRLVPEIRATARREPGAAHSAPRRSRISERTREAIGTRKELGIYRGGRALPQAEPVDIATTELIARLSADGLSSRKIAAKLDELQVPTVRGGLWQHTTVLQVLRRQRAETAS